METKNRTNLASRQKPLLPPTVTGNDAQNDAPTAADPDLALTVQRWHAMPEPIRRQLVGIVNAFIKPPDPVGQRDRLLEALRLARGVERAVDEILSREPADSSGAVSR